MAQSDVSAPEQMVLQGGLATLSNIGIWTTGQAVLTTERFYRKVQGPPFLYNFFGLLGQFISGMFPEKIDIDIPLTTITEIGRGKMGLKKDVLYIGTMDGKSYNLMPKYEAWIAGLKSVLEGQGATLTQIADERWSVQR
jgi:hypothetical protein